MTVDIKRLKEIIKAKGYTQVTLAKYMGIAKTTLNKKINTGNFLIKDVQNIVTILQLTNKEIACIFTIFK